MAQRLSQLASELWPFLLPKVGAMVQGSVSSGGSVSGGGTVGLHDLAGSLHRGTLADAQAPQFLLRNGSRSLTGNLAVDAGMTIDGVDISAHAADPDAHHARVTAGAGISVTGQQVGIASGANYQFIGTGAGTAAAWQNIAGLAGSGITYTTGTLGLTTPGTLTVSTTNVSTGSHTHAVTASSSPGQAAALLKSGTNGELTLFNGFFTQGAQSAATFASGWAGSGWRADYDITTSGKASIECDDLTVRGRMRVYELLIQQIRATNGSLVVTSSSKVVGVTTGLNPNWAVNGVQLTLNGSNAQFLTTLYTITTSTSAEDAAGKRNYHGFITGDVIRAQQVEWNGSNFAGVIQSNLEVTGVTNLYTYVGAFVSGDVPAVGYDFVRLGSTSDANRRGVVYLTSDDSAAPFIDIVDGVRFHADFNSAGVKRARFGKLTGISDVDFGGSLSGYGLYGNNVYLKGQIVVTGGSLGGLAAADVNANTTTIDGGQITANSVTASQIAANTITAAKIAAGTITATEIAASTITADRLNVTTLSAINANMGSLASGSIVIGSTNKIWLNDSADGALNIGGSTKASAPFRVTAAGALTATSATVTGVITADSGYIGTQATGWVVGSGALTSTNIGLYAGAANTARVQVGSGSGLGGINTPNISSDVVFWAGNTHANRATAAFKVDAAGQVTAADVILSSSINISGNANVTGTLTAGGNPANVRLSTDGQRFVLPDTTSMDIPTCSSALRWFAGLNDTWTNSKNYVGLTAYRHTSAMIVDGVMTVVVGDTDDGNYDARLVLQAGHYASGVYSDSNLIITREKSTGSKTINANCDSFNTSSNVYVTNNCSALSFTDRTPYFDGDALAELRGIKGKTKGGKKEIDHSTLPAFARARVKQPQSKKDTEERDLGAMISLLTVAVQQVDARLDILEGRGNGR